MARPTVPVKQGLVDTILREYLSKPTTPGMQAVKPPVTRHAMRPGAPAAPKRPPDGVGPPEHEPVRSRQTAVAVEDDAGGARYEDERPTGRWSTEPGNGVQNLVRDRGVLVRLDGDASGQVLSLPETPLLVGRSSRAHVHITDPSVSREHARIVSKNGTHYVVDQGSQNGTLIGGRRVARAELRDGDLVQFGQRATYRFSLMDGTQEQIMRRLYDSSMQDALTGADNRRHMDTRLHAEIAFAKRHERPLSFLLLDIDHFKKVNDQYGHPAGDEVLKSVADVVRGQLRTEDAFARYGGEEFAIVVRDTALSGAVHLAERVRECIGRTAMNLDGASAAVTMSIGCSSLSCCREASTEELIAVADRRLYRAKRGGRNRVVWTDDG